MIFDLVIEAGNPADSERLLVLGSKPEMLEPHIASNGQAPRQAATAALPAATTCIRAKAQGAPDIAFHKRDGLRIDNMVRSSWVYRKLRNFCAGIEADISCLKRAYDLARFTWRGLDHFKGLRMVRGGRL